MTWTRPLALALALILMPGTAMAKGLGPKDAAAKRAELTDAQPADPRDAIEHLTDAGQEFGDPELLLLAAKLAYAEADRSRDLELAQIAHARALVAQDIGAYLADERNFDATDWQPVSRERATFLADEAKTLGFEAAALADAIEAERAAAEAEAERARLAALADAEDDSKKRERRPGTGWIAGGSAALVLGAGGIGLLGAGVAMGQARQRDAEGLVIPDELERLDELDRQGAQANTLAIVGGVVGGVGVAVGVALIVVGVKKRKAGGVGGGVGDAAGIGRNRVLVGGWVEREAGGLAVQGRF